MRKAVAAVLTAAVGFIGVAAGPASAATDHQRSRSQYVALGDSYASGVGASVYDESSGECYRSPNSYPNTWAAKHRKYKLVDVTCSGAKISEVRANQLSSLSRKTKLVTLTVGGNDVGFRATLNACLAGTDAQCDGASAAAANYASTTLVSDLTSLYSQIKTKAPHAKLIVLGYPRLVEEGTGSCGDVTPNAARRAKFTQVANAVADGIGAASKKSHVRFVDMRKTFTGHEGCSADPWLHNVDLQNQLEIFHPTDEGHAAYARKLSKVTAKH